MAKLENVKTIDMVNGEITKVEYNGEIYAKVEGTAEKGDLIQSKKENRDITLGAFYKSISTGDRRPEFYDDVNDHAYLDEEYATVFRKQSAPSATATLDERVSVLESKVATLEGETEASAEPVIGGKIKAVKCLKGSTGGFVGWSKLGQGLVKIGAIGEIVDRESEGIYAKFPEGGSLGRGERFFLKHGEYEVLDEVVRETITHEGAEYKLVDRKAQPGDVVYVTKDAEGTDDIPNDAFYTVDKDEQIGEKWFHDVYKKYHNRTTDTVKVYEPVAQPLKVGDYAKVVGKDKTRDDLGAHEFNEGEIVELIREFHRKDGFECKSLTRNVSAGPNVSTPDLVRATDEEVAEAKAQAEQAAIEAKWAKIGRKPNEFKKGDIVRYKSDREICEVLLVTDSGKVKVETLNSGPCYEDKDIELFTPVESRFDRA